MHQTSNPGVNPRVLLISRVGLGVPSKVLHRANSHHVEVQEGLILKLPHLHLLPLKDLRV